MFLGPFFIYVHMLYTIQSINQRRFYEAGCAGILDFNDAALLSWIYQWAAHPQAEKVMEKGKVYVWVSHTLIIDQMPLLFNSSSKLATNKKKAQRMMDKFSTLGLIEKHKGSQRLSKSFYYITDALAALMMERSTDPRTKMSKPRTNMSEPLGQKCPSPRTKMSNDYSNKEKGNKDNTIQLGNFAASQQNSLVGDPENFQEFEAEKNTTLNTKKEKTQDLEAGGVYFSDMPEMLQDWTMEQDWDRLPKFKEQPKAKWLNKQLKDLGEDVVKEIFAKIDAHCAKNAAYSSKRKSLSRVFAQFKKGAETAIIKEMKAVVSDEYQKVFQEDYQFAKTDGRKLAELAKKIKADLVAKFGNADPSDEEIIKGFKALMGALPEKYKDADQFKVALIEYNYQSIKNQIINGKSNRNNKQHRTVGKMPNRVPKGHGNVNKYGF